MSLDSLSLSRLRRQVELISRLARPAAALLVRLIPTLFFVILATCALLSACTWRKG